jgi:hypothetical protein
MIVSKSLPTALAQWQAQGSYATFVGYNVFYRDLAQNTVMPFCCYTVFRQALTIGTL